MLFKKPLKTFLFPAANILLFIFLLTAFFMAGQNVLEVFPAAPMAALNYLQPQPLDYLWELNNYEAPMDINKIRYYKDYFEHLIQVFPSLRDAYGLIGYCYHYLGDDTQAIDDLQKAIAANPIYTWNYYNLALIYIDQYRYREASSLLEKLQLLDAQKSIKRMFASKYVYEPLLGNNDQDALAPVVQHLKISYRVSFVLANALDQMPVREDARAAVKRMKLELHAF
jgi:tetratricopeptide (TPR) repeat protein